MECVYIYECTHPHANKYGTKDVFPAHVSVPGDLVASSSRHLVRGQAGVAGKDGTRRDPPVSLGTRGSEGLLRTLQLRNKIKANL